MQVLQFVITTATALGETRGAAELALQLFLAAAGAACEVPGLEDIAYELFEQVRLLVVSVVQPSDCGRR